MLPSYRGWKVHPAIRRTTSQECLPRPSRASDTRPIPDTHPTLIHTRTGSRTLRTPIRSAHLALQTVDQMGSAVRIPRPLKPMALLGLHLPYPRGYRLPPRPRLRSPRRAAPAVPLAPEAATPNLRSPKEERGRVTSAV